jgi:predicted dinucleotide-binding enzyme
MAMPRSFRRLRQRSESCWRNRALPRKAPRWQRLHARAKYSFWRLRGGAAQNALASADDLTGKVLIDATNPLLPGLTGLAAGTTTSAGEVVAKWAAGARVVKAFNTVGFNIMADPRFDRGRAAMFYCGEDAKAKDTVASLISELGFEALDAGPVTQARLLEPHALLWISLALQNGYGLEIAFQLLRRKN